MTPLSMSVIFHRQVESQPMGNNCQAYCSIVVTGGASDHVAIRLTGYKAVEEKNAYLRVKSSSEKRTNHRNTEGRVKMIQALA